MDLAQYNDVGASKIGMAKDTSRTDAIRRLVLYTIIVIATKWILDWHHIYGSPSDWSQDPFFCHQKYCTTVLETSSVREFLQVQEFKS